MGCQQWTDGWLAVPLGLTLESLSSGLLVFERHLFSTYNVRLKRCFKGAGYVSVLLLVLGTGNGCRRGGFRMRTEAADIKMRVTV